MNRKGKIIVSVVGIFIVLLALVGITYGYFLTRIQGNTNTTSISVTTADLALVYDGDNGSIIGDNEVIEPDKTFTTKTFTVENKGNTTISNYAVILEGVSITDVTTGEAKPLNSTRDGKENDFDLVITCNDGDCNGYSDVLPEENAILVTNSIEPGEIHTYSATLKYVETNDDQSDDMNKKITGKFNIIDTNDTANLSGKVSNMGDSKYYVQTNSTKRVSYIDSNGNYNILGLEAGEHTLKLCKKSDTICSNSSAVLTKNLTIKTGTETNVNVNTGEITVSGEYKNATININASGGTTEIINSIEFNNPYKEGTLAYNIVNNAANKLNGTEYRDIPVYQLGKSASQKVVSNYKKVVNKRYSTPNETQYEHLYKDAIPYYTDSYKFYCVDKSNYSTASCEIDEEGNIILEDNQQLMARLDDTNTSSSCEIGKYFQDHSQPQPVPQDDTKSEFTYYKVLECTDGLPTKTRVMYFDYDIENVNETSGEYESSLIKTTDDKGDSYYFRGDIEDNYISFANKCWKIVRINGDGSIKLYLADNGGACNTNTTYNGYVGTGIYGYSKVNDTEYFFDYVNSEESGLADIYKEYQTSLNSYFGYLKSGDWCIDAFNGNNISLKCDNELINEFSDNTPMYVATLTADEFVYAGAVDGERNSDEMTKINSFYLNYGSAMASLTYQNINNFNSEGMPPYGLYIYKDGAKSYAYVYSSGPFNYKQSFGAVPAINLKKGTMIKSGEGTLEKPYEIKMD